MHSDEFTASANTIASLTDTAKIESLKSALAKDGAHVFVFLYMEGCGHCVASEAAWLKFTKTTAHAFAVCECAFDAFDGALGATKPQGFPSFLYVRGSASGSPGSPGSPGDPQTYDGERDADAFSAWAKEATGMTGGRTRRRRTRRRTNRKGRKGKKSRKGKKGRKSRKSRKMRARN